MPRNNEEQDMLVLLSQRINRAVDAVFRRYGVDRAYYEMRVECRRLDSNMEGVLHAHTLVDDHDTFCAFCAERTYHRERTASGADVAVCAGCCGEMGGGEDG